MSGRLILQTGPEVDGKALAYLEIFREPEAPYSSHGHRSSLARLEQEGDPSDVLRRMRPNRSSSLTPIFKKWKTRH